MAKPGTARIDHLLTYVPDLEAAGAFFARMGFTLTPSSQIETMGIANRMVLMRPKSEGQANFIELMSPYDRQRLPKDMGTVLTGDGGMRSMVLVADDIQAFHAAMHAHGFSPPPPSHARREWKIPGEPSVFPEFDVIFPVDSALRFNACKYYNLHLYLREDWTRHANTAIRITRVFAVADRPASYGFFSGLFGHSAKDLPGGSIGFPSGDIGLELLRPEEFKRRFGARSVPDGDGFAGYEIEVESMSALRASLIAGAVQFEHIGDDILVRPETGTGDLIVFTSQAVQADTIDFATTATPPGGAQPILSYGAGAIAFHWVIAALVLATLGTALIRETPLAVPIWVMLSHKALGITVLFLTVARIMWRLSHAAPPLPASLPGWQRAAASGSHVLFYVLMLALPLTGWAMASGSVRRPLQWFGLFDIPYLPVGDAVAGAAHDLHVPLGLLMVALVLLHVAAALRHHFILHDPVLARMIPSIVRS